MVNGCNFISAATNTSTAQGSDNSLKASDSHMSVRKGKVYTYLYGANENEGSLTPYITKCFDDRINE